jgi:hypothetical protein
MTAEVLGDKNLAHLLRLLERGPYTYFHRVVRIVSVDISLGLCTCKTGEFFKLSNGYPVDEKEANVSRWNICTSGFVNELVDASVGIFSFGLTQEPILKPDIDLALEHQQQGQFIIPYLLMVERNEFDREFHFSRCGAVDRKNMQFLP